MSTPQEKRGLAELSDARRESRTLFWFVGIFSFFVNLLMLTGPIYMLQVYDRVLGSRSEATLVALTLLVAFLYGMMGLLDFARGRIIPIRDLHIPSLAWVSCPWGWGRFGAYCDFQPDFNKSTPAKVSTSNVSV